MGNSKQDNSSNSSEELAPFTSLELSADQIELYAQILSDFRDAVKESDGSEKSIDDALHRLILLEDFIGAVAQGRGLGGSETLEVLFNLQVVSNAHSVNDHLGAIIEHTAQAIKKAEVDGGRDAVFGLLEKGGALIIETDCVFVRTAPELSSIGIGKKKADAVDQAALEQDLVEIGEEDIGINAYAPKLAEVIELLSREKIGGSRIYYDDLVIHKGNVDPLAVRNGPYDVIQIPKINKEIAVCNRLDEVILVSPQMRGPKVYELFKKHELENALGMRRLTYRGNWQKRLIDDLNEKLPDRISKVDTAGFVEKQLGRKMPLSPGIVGLAILKYASSHNGKLAAAHHINDPVPDMPDEDWRAMNYAGVRGRGELPQGMTISATKRYYGWTDGKGNVQKEKLNKDIVHLKKTGKLPPPVMSIDDAIKVKETPLDLSPEKIGLAILKHASSHNGKLATQQTEEQVPDMPGEKWRGINSSGDTGDRKLLKGMTIAAVKRYFGWLDKNNRKQTKKLKADIEYFRATGKLRDPVMSKEEAIAIKETTDLSVEKIAIALLRYASTHEGELANAKTTDAVPDMKNDSWIAINTAGHGGARKLRKGMTLPAIKRYYGWTDENNDVQEDKLNKDVENFRLTGNLSDPAMSVEEAIAVKETTDLSLEKIAIAQLKYALSHNGKLAAAHIKDPVPGMPGDSWLAISTAGRRGKRELPEGMDLPKIKRYFGWTDKDKLHRDILQFKKTEKLPTPVMSIEEAIESKNMRSLTETVQTMPEPS